MPQASAPKFHQRNGGIVQNQNAKPNLPCLPGDSPSATASDRRAASRFLGSQLRRIGLGHPPQARPRSGQAWSTAATRARTRSATEAAAPDATASASTRPPTRSLPREDLGIPRRPVDRCDWCNSNRSDLGYPHLGRDPLRIVFRLREGGTAPRVRLLFYVTQRSRFGYLIK